MNATLIPVFTGTLQYTPAQLCNARDLHAFLEVGRDFSNWIKDRIEQYELIEGEDYIRSPKLASGSPGNRDEKGQFIGADAIDYHLPIDTAKELAMIENNAQGRKVRRYFIRLEKFARMTAQPLLPTLKLKGPYRIDPDADGQAREAGPELLAALRLIETGKDGDGFICREAMEQVREAIAQAGGAGK